MKRIILFSVLLSISFSATLLVPSEYSTIQSGIDASSDGDTVLVSAGTYYENINFNGKNIAVIGEDRETTIIDGGQNGSVVTFESGEAEGSTLAELSIQNGYEIGYYPSYPFYKSGGITCHNSSPNLNNLIIINNSSENGGGIICINSSPLLSNVIVQYNTALNGGGCNGYGGGIYCYNSSPTIVNSIVAHNVAGGCDNGGGIFLELSSNPYIENTIIESNSAGYGGGISAGNSSEPYILNSTIVNNSSSQSYSHEVYFYNINNSDIINSIIWNALIDDSASLIDIECDQPDDDDNECSNIIFSDIKGGWEGEGNIDTNPIFTDTENGDFTLQPTSPCIDAGDPNSPLDPDGTVADMGAYYFDQSGGCTNPGACNYSPVATEDDGSCLFFDCAGECGGIAIVDECGECDGDNATCSDCLGIPNGTAVVDECDVCDGDGIPDGECDCFGNVLDECGVCGGYNSDCSGCTDENALNYNSEAVLEDGSCSSLQEVNYETEITGSDNGFSRGHLYSDYSVYIHGQQIEIYDFNHDQIYLGSGGINDVYGGKLQDGILTFVYSDGNNRLTYARVVDLTNPNSIYEIAYLNDTIDTGYKSVFYDCALTDDYLIIVGWNDSSNANGTHARPIIFVVDRNSFELLTSYIFPYDYQQLTDIEYLEDNTFLVGGSNINSNGGGFIKKIQIGEDDIPVEIWSRSIGGKTNNIVVMNDGNIGYSDYNYGVGVGKIDNENGDLIWSTSIEVVSNDGEGAHLLVTPDNGLMISGLFGDGDDFRSSIIKLSNTGIFQFEKDIDISYGVRLSGYVNNKYIMIGRHDLGWGSSAVKYEFIDPYDFGCTEQNAFNYNQWAEFDDGSCEYDVLFLPHAQISSITDISNDQGGRVYAHFYRSHYDSDGFDNRVEFYTIERFDDDWVSVGTQGTYNDTLYSVEVNTLSDFTEADSALTQFRIIAHMEEGNFLSETAEGYSVDNIHPSTPDDVTASITDNDLTLSWGTSPDVDFSYSRITDLYNPEVYTIENTFNTSFVESYNEYFVNSIDTHDNISENSEIVSAFELHEGANLISLNILPNDANPEFVFGNASYGAISEGVATVNQDGTWVGSLTEFNTCDGYWVFMDDEISHTVIGESSECDYSLHEGNNLKSYPCNSEVQTSSAINNECISGLIGEGMAGINIEGNWFGSLQSLHPGDAYWITSDCEIPSFEFNCSEPELTRAINKSHPKFPEGMSYAQSSSQGFYFIENIELSDREIESGDWVLAYHNNQLIGARMWEGVYTDIPLMGKDLQPNTASYLNMGNTPTLKVLTQDGELYDVTGELEPWSEGCMHVVSSLSTESSLPTAYRLASVYPNPFNPQTNIVFDMPESKHVNLIIYDLLGRQVEQLISENINAGTHKITWDAEQYPSGIYIVQFNANNISQTQKIVLVK
jgi:hypothetical protein